MVHLLELDRGKKKTTSRNPGKPTEALRNHTTSTFNVNPEKNS
jgi:hypothetical protein